MTTLTKFDFSEEVLNSFRHNKTIPVDFYNKDGQILIHKKSTATEVEVNRVERFIAQGIYYRNEDAQKIRRKSSNSKRMPPALSSTKLLSKKHADEMSTSANEILEHIRSAPFNSHNAQKSAAVLEKVFVDFKSQPDAMNGIVNILDLMNEHNESSRVEMMVKRSIIAMSLKTRGLSNAAQDNNPRTMEELVNRLMLISFLCDISYTKMDIPTDKELTSEQYQHIQNHPIISYLMLAHVENISTEMKQSILLHHHPIRSVSGTVNNNYPSFPSIKQSLATLCQKYQDNANKAAFLMDAQRQIQMLEKNVSYDEDANIIAIASAFASLTSNVSWRASYTASQAVRQMINLSLFTFSNRTMREFLDHIAMSLCDNQQIIKKDNFIIIAVSDNQSKVTQFEVAKVINITHLQSKPYLRRIGILRPTIICKPRWHISDINLATFKSDTRRAHYDLSLDNSRRIVYLIDADEDAQACEVFHKASID